MQVEYKSTKSESVFKVTGEKDRAFLEVTGQASTKAKCCECGTECDKSMMAWVGNGVYKCKMCLLMRRNDG